MLSNAIRHATVTTLTSLLFLAGCSTSPTPDGPVELGNSDDLQITDNQQPNAVKPQAFLMRGTINAGHQVSSFSPCNSSEQYWLNVSGDQQEALSKSGGPVYGELVGYFSQPASNGFAADYLASFNVEKINLMSTDMQGCGQARKQILAHGASPQTWSAAIEGDKLAVNLPGVGAKAFTIDGQKSTPDSRIYLSDTLSLTLKREACQETSGSMFGWQATLSAGEDNFYGCAVLPPKDVTQHWVGKYQGQTAIEGQSALESTLVLKDDHTATTTYQQGDDTPIVEKGIWQQVSPDKVHVLMTRHDRQRLISERVYTRQGFALTAQEETVSGQTYALGEDGLTLNLVIGAVGESNTSAQAPLSTDKVPGSAEFDTEVEATLAGYIRAHQQDLPKTRYRWLKQDINGDNHPELFTLLDWCGSGGCTLLVFKGSDSGWQFNSRMTLVHAPFQVSQQTHHGWHDLILSVGGGGAQPSSRVLQHNGISYPYNPSTAPDVGQTDPSDMTLFSDGVYPAQQGRTLAYK